MMSVVYVILAILAIIMLFQMSVRMKGWLRKGKPAPKVSGILGKHILKGEKIIAYFYSPTCRACKTQEQYWPGVQKKFDNIIRINAAKDRDIAQAFGIMGTPTTIIIDRGIIRDYFVGITSPNKILKSLKLTG
jgi:thioredoxin 1